MGKVRKLLSCIRALVRNPAVLGRVLDEQPPHRQRLKQEYGLPHGLPAVDILDLFPGFAEEVEPYSFLYGTSPVIDIAILKALARRFHSCSYLEIGSWRGESIVNVASVAAQCTSISLSREDMIKRGYSKRHVETHLCYANGKKNIRFIGHDSQTFDYSTLDERFDLIFVDGDHSYQGVVSDTRNAFKLLRDEKSVLVWHDCMVMYEQPRWDVMAAILDGTPKERRASVFHISNTLCAVCLPINHRLESSVSQFPARPNKCFSVSISAKRCPDPS